MNVINQDEKYPIIVDWVRDYGPIVTRMAFYYVQDKMVAEDIAQDVFLRAYQHMGKYRGDASVKTWLCRITINACKDYLKSWAFRATILTKIVNGQGLALSAEDDALKKLSKIRLLKEIMGLPVIYREAILLRYFEQMKVKEIASLLVVKETTVRARLERGITKLRKQLSNEEAWALYGEFIR